MLKSKHYRIAWITWSALIAILSFTPGNYIAKIDWDFQWPDVLAHFTFYFGMAVIFFPAWKVEFNRKSIIFLFTGCFLYGLFIEIVQGTLIPGRFFGLDDLVVNSIGSIAGLLSYTGLRRFL